MSWQTWWLFLLTETVLSISPGPAVLFVVAQAMRSGVRQGLRAALGIVSANVIWFALSALGVGALLLASGGWFLALKWLGAGYLIWLALTGIFGAGHFGGANPSSEGSLSARGAWRRGLVLQLTNPKALVFFVALLPQFVDPAQPVGRQIAILGVTSILAEFPVLAIYSLVADRAARLAAGSRYARAVDVVAGILLIAAAVGIAVGRSPTVESAGAQLNAAPSGVQADGP